MIQNNLKLCYIDGNAAYFTDRPLDQQWGDDWDDAPYEHNAGEPYSHNGEQIYKLYFEGSFDRPEDHHTNSPYSVEMINRGAIAWLRPSQWGNEHKVLIHAGASVEDFIRLVEESGGTVYLPKEK